MRERLTEKAERAQRIVERLALAYPEAATELRFDDPFQLLVAVVLSAQCTDARVNQATPELFARFPSVQAFAAAKPRQVEPFIKSLGLFRNKARSIVAAARQLSAAGGRVPTRRAELAALPGIGNKSAGVIAMHLGEPEAAFPVDTHVARLAFRLWLSSSEKPDRIEADLQRLLPPATWSPGHHRLIWHGRRVCTARSPSCQGCVVLDLCPRRGLPPLETAETPAS